MSIRTADGFMNFKCCLHFYIFWFNFSVRYIAKHDLRCMQFVDSACKGIQRVTENFLQRLIRISASLLQAAGRQMTASNTFLFSRIFLILHAVSNTFWLFAKRRQTTLRTETKGNPVTIPNNVTQVILFIVILNSSLLVTLSVKSAKGIIFHKLKKLLV
jgi:hypothetical protein